MVSDTPLRSNEATKSNPPFEPQRLDLARQRVAPPAEQLRRLEPLAAGAAQRGDDQRALERGQRLGQERLRRPRGELAFGPLRELRRPVRGRAARHAAELAR